MNVFKKLIQYYMVGSLEIIKFSVIFFLVGYAWAVLEHILMGEITQRKVDNVIAIIFTLSLYCNLKNLGTKRKVG